MADHHQSIMAEICEDFREKLVKKLSWMFGSKKGKMVELKRITEESI